MPSTPNPFVELKKQLKRAPLQQEIVKMKFEPGHVCPVSGQYMRNDDEQITMVKGKRFPAGPKTKDTWYRLTDHTR